MVRNIGARVIYSRFWDIPNGAFEDAINRAITSCEQSGNNPQYHFADTGKMIGVGKGGTREVDDFHLSRFACYLIAQNGDPRNRKLLMRKNILPFRLASRSSANNSQPTRSGSNCASKLRKNSRRFPVRPDNRVYKTKCSERFTMQAIKSCMADLAVMPSSPGKTSVWTATGAEASTNLTLACGTSST